MVRKKSKTGKAIRNLLYPTEESSQLGLFDVSDSPLRKSIFDDNNNEKEQGEARDEETESAGSKK